MSDKNEDPITPADEPEADVVNELTVDVDDFDAQEFAAAQAAVDAEESGEEPEAEEPELKEPVEPEPEAGDPQPEGAEEGDGEKPDPVMIPKARFDQVNQAKNKAEDDLAFLRGKVEVLERQQTPQAAPTPEIKEPTAEEKISNLEEQKTALAEKFDSGEITAVEWEKQRQSLDGQVFELRMESVKPAAQPAAQLAPPPVTDLALEQETQRLRDEHPYIQAIPEAGFNYLVDQAVFELTNEGVLPDGNIQGALNMFKVRERVATLSDRFGPAMTGKSPEEIGLVKPTPKPAEGLSPEAKARKAKLELAENQPPNLGSMTGSSADDGALTEEKLAGMSEEELDAIPDAAIDKILNS